MEVASQYLTLPCAECGTLFCPQETQTQLCLTCISKQNDISSKIPKLLLLPWCRYCHKYFGTSWILCQRESKELLSICLKKLRGLQELKILEANFTYSEEHSKRIYVKVKVEKAVNDRVSVQ